MYFWEILGDFLTKIWSFRGFFFSMSWQPCYTKYSITKGGRDIKYSCRRYPISDIDIALSDIGKKFEGFQSDIGSIR
jgi:hypothetical protein